MNKQATNWEKLHPKHMSGKGVVSKLDKLFLQLKNKLFTKEDTPKSPQGMLNIICHQKNTNYNRNGMTTGSLEWLQLK